MRQDCSHCTRAIAYRRLRVHIEENVIRRRIYSQTIAPMTNRRR